MTRTAIRDHFSRNKRRHDIDNALTRVTHANLIERRHHDITNGPAVETWYPRDRVSPAREAVRAPGQAKGIGASCSLGGQRP